MWPGPHAGQLGAVIGDEGGGLAALGGHRSADARTGERRICHRSEAFAGKVLDDGVDAKPPPRRSADRAEIQRPIAGSGSAVVSGVPCCRAFDCDRRVGFQLVGKHCAGELRPEAERGVNRIRRVPRRDLSAAPA
jgi:hypothetical protein